MNPDTFKLAMVCPAPAESGDIYCLFETSSIPGARNTVTVPGFTVIGERDPSLAIPVVFLVLRGFQRQQPPSRAAGAMADYLDTLLAETAGEALLDDPRLAGYRALHAARGKLGRQYLPSPESLFRLLFKRREWRSIDPLVDAYSLVSLQTRVSIGAHDLDCLRLPVQLAPTVGGEQLLVIGEDKALRLGSDEYVYRDADGQLLGRMECRQAVATRVTPATRNLLFILQGHAELRVPALRDAAQVLQDTLRALVGEWKSALPPCALESP
jgi:DNA/RNA-binding domain of Phe-tRNA-synthetase-like protein